GGGGALFGLPPPVLPRGRSSGVGGRRAGSSPRALPLLRAEKTHGPAVGTLQDRVPLVPPAALGLLESVRRRRVYGGRLRGAPAHRGPLQHGREREEAPQQQDPPVLGRLHAAKASLDSIIATAPSRLS